MLIVFDDDKNFRNAYREMFPKMGIEISTLECGTKEEIRSKLSDKDILSKLKILIFDLCSSKIEEETLDFEILEDIKNNHEKYAIPIFIHSAFADKVSGYDNLGTVFKIKKSKDSIQTILEKIELFYKSGFLEIFAPGGSLEREITQNIVKAFNEQFHGKEIESIIKSIKHADEISLKSRTKTVFERIAIRSLYQNMLSAKRLPDVDKIEEIKINAVEHYYRRNDDFPVWTGDIFRNIESNEDIIILTPRCDINNGYCNNRFLICFIDRLEEKKVKEFAKEQDKIRNYLSDNPQNTGHKYRYLIPTPSYRGGRINLPNYSIMEMGKFSGEKKEYQYIISLSDELTNDIVRKFSTYIMRSGISASDTNEASYFSSEQERK